jgi:hypothetical protein
LVDIIAISIGAAALIKNGRRRIANITIIHFTVVSFYAHVLRIDRAQMHSRCDLQRFTDQNALSVFVSDLNVRNLHRRPILAYLRFPLAQVRGGAAAVARKILVRFRGRNIKLLGVFLHHPLRVKSRRDASDRFTH